MTSLFLEPLQMSFLHGRHIPSCLFHVTLEFRFRSCPWVFTDTISRLLSISAQLPCGPVSVLGMEAGRHPTGRLTLGSSYCVELTGFDGIGLALLVTRS
jgi:hypothetical protein